MKRIWLIGLLVIAGYFSQAQKSEVEAKAAYLLAEEFYGKGDYKAALDYLQQVKVSLGGSNCKILYLEIMATRELHTKDPSLADKVLPLIAEFEKSSDYADFNEEKSLEISKLKLLMKGEQKAAREELNRLAEVKIAREKRIDSLAKARTPAQKTLFINAVTELGQFNITLDELDKANPKWKVKKWVVEKLSPTVDFYHNAELNFNAADFPFPNGPKASLHGGHIVGVYIKEGKITGYYVLWLYFNYVSGATNSYNWFVAQPVTAANLFSSMYQLDPIITPLTINGVTAKRYLWTEGRYGYMIDEMHYPSGDGGIVKAVQTYFYNPTEKETATYHPAEK